MRSKCMALVALLLAVPASAKNLYVNNSGSPACSDSTTYAANDASNPWCTIGRAAWGSTTRTSPNASQAAQAGDVVNITAGSYATAASLSGGARRFDVALGPANSGTAGNPIRFVVTGADPTNTTTLATISYNNGGSGPAIGCSSRSYIEWEGFYLVEGDVDTARDTGPMVGFMSTGCVFAKNRAYGQQDTDYGAGVEHPDGDNYPGIRFEDCTDCEARNNWLERFGQNGDRNHNGIEIYRSFGQVIENNYFLNNAVGIYEKAVNTSTLTVDTVTIRYNQFVGNRWGIQVLRMPMVEATPMFIYQNIFEANTEAGLWINVFDNGTTDAKWIRVVNNTFYNEVSCIATYNYATWNANTEFLFWNNICSESDRNIRVDTSNVATNLTKDRHDFEHNVYYNATNHSTLGGSNATLSTWQTTYGQDNVSPVALTSNPLFANVASGDFRLCTAAATPDATCSGASPALTQGRVTHSIGGVDGATIPAGAYITGSETIGLGGAEPPPSTVPDAPTIGTATAGNARCTVTFTANSNGGSPVTVFTATSSPGSLTGTAAASPITVTGLTNGQAYTFTVTATNAEGTSSASSASNSCTPAAATTTGVQVRIRVGGA